MMKLCLFGGTDLTRMVADTLVEIGQAPAGLVYVRETFNISYSKKPVKNVKYADMAAWAGAHETPAYAFESNDGLITFAQEIGFDFALVAGWYHMIPARVRALFPLGCAGFHASLLPLLRGGAPLNWAILQGASETGISFFCLDDGIDDGPIYAQEKFPIEPRATITGLLAKSEAASIKMVRAHIPAIANGTLTASPQDKGIPPTYCLQRTPEDGAIDWNKSAGEIDRLVRAVSHPYSGATCRLDARDLTIWGSDPEGDLPVIIGAPGQIAHVPGIEAPIVVTGQSALRITEATFEDGGNALPELLKSANKRLSPVARDS